MKAHLPNLGVACMAALISASPALAQGWLQFTSIEDRFSVNFPEEPAEEEFTYITADETEVPARIYSAMEGQSRYVVTAIDFAEHYEPHATTVQGSMARAAARFRQSVAHTDAITYDAYMRIDRIPGHALQIRKPDGGLLYVLILLHEDENLDAQRLYITEAHVPPGAPPPGAFQQSFQVLDAEGNDIRYSPDGLSRVD